MRLEIFVRIDHRNNMRNPYLTTVRRRKGMIDLTFEGRMDWFPVSIRETNERIERQARELEVEAIQEYGATPIYSLPNWTYPPKEKLSWFQMLSGWEMESVWNFIKGGVKKVLP